MKVNSIEVLAIVGLCLVLASALPDHWSVFAAGAACFILAYTFM